MSIRRFRLGSDIYAVPRTAGYFPYVSQLRGRYLFDMGQLHGGGVRVTFPL